MDSITIIGLCAASFTTFAFLPQLIKTIKLKQTKDLSLMMYLVFVIGIVLWLIYGINKNDLPIILANIVSLLLSGTVLVLKIIYK